MKKKFRRVLPRLLALFLILTVIVTPTVINVFAVDDGNMSTSGAIKSTDEEHGTVKAPATATGEPTNVGATNSDGPKDPNCNGYSVQGVMLRLVSIPNQAKGEEYQSYMESYNASLTLEDKISECQLTAVKEYLYDFPKEFLSNTSVTENAALIVQRGSSLYTDVNQFGPPYVYKTGDGLVSQHSFDNVYNVTLGTPADAQYWFPASLTSGSLRHTGDPEFLNSLFNGEKTLADIEPYIENNYTSATNQILELFKDTSRISDMLGGMWTEASNAKDEYGRPVQDIYRLFYLDLLLAINHMCGDEYTDEINEYLKGWNANGADNFVIPIMANVMIFRKTGGDGRAWVSTLPDYYGWISNKGAATFASNQTLSSVVYPYQQAEGDGRQDLASNYSAHTQSWWGKYEALLPSKSPVGNEAWLRRKLWWTSVAGNSNSGQQNWANAFGLLPTDCFGRATGNIGYTYLALGGGSGMEKDNSFKLTVQSNQKEVEKDSNVAATLNIDLKQPDVSTVRNAFTENGDTATFTVQLGVTSVEGSAATAIIDTIKTAPTGATKSGNILTVNNLKLADIEPYIKGTKLIQVIDQNMTISQKTTNKYTAIVTLKWANGKSLQFEAAGKTIESTYQASDKVSWTVADDDPNSWHYYSTIGKSGSTGNKNYVEIKHNSPGNESYEAMAGVPTTEDLYVGFGATEFMVNLDAKLDASNGTRTYTFTYNAANCIGEDEACEYSCPGNHGTGKTGGCNALICKNTDSKHEHSDSCYCNSGSYSKADFDCSDGEYEWEYKCSCGNSLGSGSGKAIYGSGYTECIGGDGTTDYTGMGCKHTKHTNSTHKGVTFTGVITQKIDPFYFMNITGLNMWRVSKLEYKGNNKLLSNPNQVWDPNTGYYSFYNQDGYKNDNGRLIFITNLDKQDICNRNIWGNTAYNCPNPSTEYITWKEACKLAAEWMNECKASTQVSAIVVSDYLSLCTTEGYQTPAFHSYDSDIVQLTDASFTIVDFEDNVHSKSLEGINGNNITFSNPVDGFDLWVNNGNTAFNWESDHITRSGYNGDYANPSSKWNNVNVTSAKTLFVPGTTNNLRGGEESIEWFNALAKEIGKSAHPNSKNREGNKSFATGFSNLRMTKTGLNIIDSTDTETKTWSASDSKQPVLNGEWDTGKCYITAKKEISFESNKGGTDYATEADGSFKEEVGYTASKSKVNNIVVHNPVSVQNATVICNDKQYDLRTASSLAEGGDPVSNISGCPNSAACQYQTLICTEQPTPHTDACYAQVNVAPEHIGGLNSHQHTTACTHVHSMEAGCYVGCTGGYIITSSKPHYENHEGCGYGVNGNPNCNNGINGMDYSTKCSVCGYIAWNNSRFSSCPKRTLVCTKSTAPNAYCTNETNNHTCTSMCHSKTQKVLTCQNPHHYVAGDPVPEVVDGKIVSAMYHYDYGDARCWQPCGDDSKHEHVPEVKLGDGSTVQTSNIFVNLDREVWIYVPDEGDFAQQPSLHGILETTSTRGMGYYDGMDCDTWTRDKYVIFPFMVTTEDGYTYEAYKPINLYYLTSHYYTVDGKRDNGYYKFYCLLANNEAVNAKVQFLSIATNAEERYYDESIDVTNKERCDSPCKARHTVSKNQFVDVVGYIGSLTMNDTGDFRFATLFKTEKNNGEWLIKNLVPEVYMNLPKTILSDRLDVRQEVANEDTVWHGTYGNTYADTGGKAYQYTKLPLTPADNPIKELKNQPLRPGYQLYMDIETVGNYYGENRNEEGALQDSELYYKMQVTPRYWALDLDTGDYHPVDIYMGKDGEYTPVVKFSTNASEVSEYIYYLKWLEESARRNYTTKEKEATVRGVEYLTQKLGSDDNPARSPSATADPIGTAARLFLNDLNRTFIGSSSTYGQKIDKWDIVNEAQYNIQSQRWHFTLGLPSSSVFVKAGKPCTDGNIKEIADMNAVIVCAIDIKVKGTVWTLEYNGDAVNNSDGSGFQVEPGGTVYPPPVDPETGELLDDPIIAVYSNKMTSANDLRTEGSH